MPMIHAFSYIVYGNCMAHHGLPVPKHNDILPWHTMVYFHKDSASRDSLLDNYI